MARSSEIVDAGGRGGEGAAGQSAVLCGDTSGDGRVARVNGDRVGGALGVRVFEHHLREGQALGDFRGNGGADETADIGKMPSQYGILSNTGFLECSLRSLVPASKERDKEGLCISNLVYRTRKAIWASVIDSAAMIKSPSFSRSCESRTIMNSPFSEAQLSG